MSESKIGRQISLITEQGACSGTIFYEHLDESEPWHTVSFASSDCDGFYTVAPNQLSPGGTCRIELGPPAEGEPCRTAAPGDRVYFLLGPRLWGGTVASATGDSVEIVSKWSAPPGSGGRSVVHRRDVALWHERVAVVREAWRGQREEERHRIERELYPESRLPALMVHPTSPEGAGRVVEREQAREILQISSSLHLPTPARPN